MAQGLKLGADDANGSVGPVGDAHIAPEPSPATVVPGVDWLVVARLAASPDASLSHDATVLLSSVVAKNSAL